MAESYLYRERDGLIIPVKIAEATITRPAILPTHPMRRGLPTTTGRQRTPTTVQVTVTISTAEMGLGAAEDLRLTLIDSAELWRLYTPGRPGERDLMIGTTSERRNEWEVAYIDMELQQIEFFDVVTEAVAAPRADAAAGLSAPKDLGSVAPEEPSAQQGSLIDRLIFGGFDS